MVTKDVVHFSKMTLFKLIDTSFNSHLCELFICLFIFDTSSFWPWWWLGLSSSKVWGPHFCVGMDVIKNVAHYTTWQCARQHCIFPENEFYCQIFWIWFFLWLALRCPCFIWSLIKWIVFHFSFNESNCFQQVKKKNFSIIIVVWWNSFQPYHPALPCILL